MSPALDTPGADADAPRCPTDRSGSRPGLRIVHGWQTAQPWMRGLMAAQLAALAVLGDARRRGNARQLRLSNAGHRQSFGASARARSPSCSTPRSPIGDAAGRRRSRRPYRGRTDVDPRLRAGGSRRAVGGGRAGASRRTAWCDSPSLWARGSSADAARCHPAEPVDGGVVRARVRGSRRRGQSRRSTPEAAPASSS